MSVQDIVEAHWAKFGRNYYTRFDYEGLSPDAADGLMNHLVHMEFPQGNCFVFHVNFVCLAEKSERQLSQGWGAQRC